MWSCSHQCSNKPRQNDSSVIKSRQAGFECVGEVPLQEDFPGMRDPAVYPAVWDERSDRPEACAATSSRGRTCNNVCEGAYFDDCFEGNSSASRAHQSSVVHKGT